MQSFYLGSWLVDPAARQLRAGPATRRVSPKAMKVLSLLAETSGRVVSRDEILKRVWPDVVVGEEVLTHAVAELRRQLDDSSRAPRFIETLHKSGYRLLADVKAGAASTGGPVREPKVKSVAVHPFANLSDSPALDAFAIGIADEIIDGLTGLAGLRVAVDGAGPAGACVCASASDAGAHVEGNLKGTAARLRISARIVDHAGGSYVWSRVYDRSADRPFAVQREIGQDVTTAVGSALGCGPVRRLREESGNLDAYVTYLQARDHLERGGKQNIRSAVDLFSGAIDLDPRSASAHAGLANALAFLFMYYEPSRVHLERALDVARNAVAMDPGSGGPQLALAWVQASAGAFAEARRGFGAAVRLDPDSFGAHYLFGRACFGEGEFVLAATMLERAAQIRSDDFHSLLIAAKARRGLGDTQRARRAYCQALARVEAYLACNPEDLRAICDKVCCLVELEAFDEALRCAAPVSDSEDPLTYYLACALARAGELSPALDCLERIVGTGWSHAGWLRSDPDLDVLRREVRFKRIESSLGVH